MPNPLQKLHKTNTKQFGHNPRVELCPKSTKKSKKNGGFDKKWFSGGLGTKWEIWDFGWPAVVFWWWGKWMPEVGWAYFGFREERDGGGFGVFVRLLEKWGKGGGGNVT
jgi:hypothetical protein